MSTVEAQDLVQQGIALAQSGDKAQARTVLRQAVELDPTSEQGWLWLAGAAESAQEALAALERVLTLNPGHERARSAAHAARLQLGVTAARSGKKPRARALLRVVVAAEPENELAWLWLANIAETPADAVACLEKVLSVNPDNTLARTTLERCRGAVRTARPAGPRTPVAPTAALAADKPKPRPPEKTVLVVDDRRTVREQIAQTLEDGGYQVRPAADGYEAVDLLRDRGAPDLILLTAALRGGVDGYQLCKLLRENPTTTHLPILLMSEKAGLFRKMRGGLAGATAELTEPFTAEELLRLVHEHCPSDAGPK